MPFDEKKMLAVKHKLDAEGHVRLAMAILADGDDLEHCEQALGCLEEAIGFLVRATTALKEG